MSLVEKTTDFTGNIQLINISNIAVGIVSTKIYYATSESGTEPPTFSTKELKIKGTDRILTFADTGANFKVLENSDGEKTLWVDYENELVELNVTSNDIINGIIGVGEGDTKWSETIPLVNPGQFLWTKTVHTYNDGSVSVTYGLYHWGADAEVYTIECNCDEIIKFKKANSEDENSDADGVVISPTTLNIKIRNQAAEETENIYKKNLKIKVYSLETGEEYYITEEAYNYNYITQDLTKQYITVELNQLVQKTLQDIKSDTSVPKVNKILIEDDCFVTIEYDHDLTYEGTTVKTYHLTQYLGVRYGMNSDMAKLSVKAEGINMAMGDSKLVFDANGLTIKNGYFKIKDKNNKDVLYADNDGNLALKGNIYAKGGTIGGFVIEENSLKAVPVDGDGNQFTDDSGNLISTIELSGSNGKIFVGRSDNNSNRIEIDGPNGTISSGVYNENSTSWSLSHDEAIFNNIVARGAIKAAVFEYGRVQAVGGMLIVRPSTRITKIESVAKTNDATSEEGTIPEETPERKIIEEGTTVEEGATAKGDYEIKVTVEELLGFEGGDYCLIQTRQHGELYFNVLDIPSEDSDSKVITLSTNSENDYNNILAEPLPCLIIDFGKKAIVDEQGKVIRQGSIGIGISASDNPAIIPSNSISVFELDSKGEPSPRAILGLISGTNDKSIDNTYGLYADNAFLRGSLVTEAKKASENNPVYSGIGTNFGANAPLSDGTLFPENGNILLWAGARSTAKEDIEKANFYVDERGNVYGNSVYLIGSLITDSFIEAAEIKTAVIYGYESKDGKPGPAALSIRDANNGFSFEKKISQDPEKYSSLFEITANEVSTILPLRSKESINSNSYLQINSETDGEEEKVVHSIECYVYDEKKDTNELKANMNFNDEEISIRAKGTTEKVKISSSMVEINGALRLGNMNYSPVYDSKSNYIGYDLFVGG